MKKCCRCKKTKSYDMFYKCSKAKDGLLYYCKQCKKIETSKPENILKKAENGKKRRAKNKDKLKKKHQQYYINNKESMNKKSKEYYENNKERLYRLSREYISRNRDSQQARQKTYREDNRDSHIEYMKKYYIDNKELLNKKGSIYAKKNRLRINKYVREKREENKDEYNKKKREYYKIRKAKDPFFIRFNNHKRRQLVRDSKDGTVTKVAMNQMLIDQEYKCAITGQSLIVNGELCFHMDHIYPLSKGGTHTIKNMQLTTPSANLKKSNKIPEHLLSKHLQGFERVTE